MMDVKKQLQAGLQALDLPLNHDTQDHLLHYLALLKQWNKTYNLTAITNPREMVIKHLLDSLAIGPHLHGEHIIDVGTGGGLPGIPLALTFPTKAFTLLDSAEKKTRFLRHVCTQLALENVTIEHARVEQFHPQHAGFESILSRAFASLKNMLGATQHLLAPDGVFIAMKGVYPAEELDEIPTGFILQDCIELAVPGLEAKRHIVIVKRQEKRG